MDFITPVMRLVQGSVIMQAQKDMETNQPLLNPDGTPEMGIFMALAAPKILPGTNQPNVEFDAFYAQMKQCAAAAWPTLYPQGALGPCVHPRFSMKYQDGDGVGHNGQSVAGKAGFAGHHIIKLYTSYPLRCFYEGKFGPHEEIQKPDDVIKRGYWVRAFGEMKSNNATGNQVPGISLYPKLVSFVAPGEEIASGPDAQQALGGAQIGWRPAASASPIPTPGAVQTPQIAIQPPAVQVPAVQVPSPQMVIAPAPQLVIPPAPQQTIIPPAPPAGPVVAPQFAAQGVTWEMLAAQGWTPETAKASGYVL